MRTQIQDDALQVEAAEEWRPIPDFISHEISNQGRVRHVRGTAVKIKTKSGHRVGLWRDGREHSCSVAELVCSAFCGTRPADGIVIHLDMNKANLRASNLEWAPQDEAAQRYAERLAQLDPSKRWCPVPGYAAEYAIADSGEIFGVKRCKLIKPSRDKDGYLKIELNQDGKARHWRHHRLMMLTFVGEPPTDEHTQVNHEDGIKNRNVLENLSWATPAENLEHSREVLGNYHGGKRGEDCYLSKLKETDVLTIYRQYREGVPMADIAKRFDVVVGTIDDIVGGRAWKHLHARHGGPASEERTRREKLTERQVRQIHHIALELGEKHDDIATAYGVSRTAITHILNGITWRNIYAEFAQRHEAARCNAMTERKARQIIAIRQFAPEERQSDIAKVYGVSRSLVGNILRGDSWSEAHADVHDAA